MYLFIYMVLNIHFSIERETSISHLTHHQSLSSMSSSFHYYMQSLKHKFYSTCTFSCTAVGTHFKSLALIAMLCRKESMEIIKLYFLSNQQVELNTTSSSKILRY